MCVLSHKNDEDKFLLHRSHNPLIILINFSLMNWQNLYQKQLDENQELKKQLDIAESILREYLPIVENNDEVIS